MVSGGYIKMFADGGGIKYVYCNYDIYFMG